MDTLVQGLLSEIHFHLCNKIVDEDDKPTTSLLWNVLQSFFNLQTGFEPGV
jgi:hypothetical protein